MVKKKYMYHSSSTIFSLILNLLQGEYYGVDWNGPAPNNSTDDHVTVEVPIIRNPLHPVDYASLTNSIDPLRESDEYGVDIYLEALSFIHTIISNY